MARAAEISHRVVSKINFLRSESQTLELLTEIEKDFDEVTILKQVLHFGYRASDIKPYESEIRDYASKIFTRDMNLSNTFLQDAARRDLSIQQLCLKYPDFCSYLSGSRQASEKAVLLAQLQG